MEPCVPHHSKNLNTHTSFTKIQDSHGNVIYKWTTLCFFIWRDTKIIYVPRRFKCELYHENGLKAALIGTTLKNMSSWWCCIWWICFILDTFITCYNIYVAGNWGQSVGMFCYCLCSLSHLPWFLLGRRKCVDTIRLDGNLYSKYSEAG